MIEQNIAEIEAKIEAALRACGRTDSAEILAVTKQVTAENVLLALQCGLKNVGENKFQEAQEKFPRLEMLGAPAFCRHMIGHLQSNKVRRAVELFDVIQSVDSLEILQRIDRAARDSGKVQTVLLELKLSEESTKFGLAESDLETVLDGAQALANVRVVGLMGMAPYFEDGQRARPYFARARRKFEQFFKMPNAILSMGMSNDFEAALAEGSTMVRIGSAIFGERVQKTQNA